MCKNQEEEAFRDDLRDRELHAEREAKGEASFRCFALGHDCDRNSWLQVRALWGA